jgi:anaerobic magnesium-protoporphyrin IX monomethyl ester cyclase
MPDESFEDVLDTIKLNIKCKPDFAWASLFQPYPSTDLSNYSIKKGYFNLHELDSINVNFHKNSVIKTKDIRRIERLHHFFYFAMDFPFLIPFIKLLIKVPLNNIYYIFWSFYRGFGYYFRLKVFDFSELFIRK